MKKLNNYQLEEIKGGDVVTCIAALVVTTYFGLFPLGMLFCATDLG